MATITADTLKSLQHGLAADKAMAYAAAFDGVLAYGEITSPLRVAHFMAQMAYESAGFRALVESLNYSAQTLYATFPKRIQSVENAKRIIAQGKAAVAEAIYGQRTSLGNVNAGDGFKYIGRGFTMVTGRANYEEIGRLLGLNLVDTPELLEDPATAARASAAYWKSRSINAAADANDIERVTKLINGGLNGIDGRKAYFAKASAIWPAAVATASTAAATAVTAGTAAAAGVTRLSRYFTLEELTFSDFAERAQIDNTPDTEIKSRLTATATQMDAVRDLLGAAIQVNSGYRSPALNTAIKGARNSAHTQGYAVDFVCRPFGSPLDICNKILGSTLRYDQLIQEGKWVHISFDPQMRQQVFTAVFANGTVHYRPGL